MPGTLGDWVSRPHLTFASLPGERVCDVFVTKKQIMESKAQSMKFQEKAQERKKMEV